ncbi:MAG: HAD-IA family hydrolase [Candidatus Dojkabacteria bacterium]|nr:HAD-IA family hydrolase [Candidatus Dojkabacteria bacterium]
MKDLPSIILKTELLIFDLNGTLLRKKWRHVAILRTLLDQEFDLKISYSQTLKLFNKNDQNVIVVLDKLLTRYGFDVNLTDLSSLVKKYLENGLFSANNIPTVPYAKRFIKWAYENNKKLALFTRTSAKTVNIIFDKLEWGRYFHVIVTSDDVVRTKPSPEGINRILDITNIDHESAIFFEDNRIGILAGKRANVITCLVGMNKNNFNLADFKIKNYKKIYTMLNNYKY